MGTATVDFTVNIREASDRVVLDGVKGAGSVGTSLIFYAGHRIPVRWQLRFVDDNGNPIPTLPYSLAFASSCHLRGLEEGKKGLKCRECGALQEWAATCETMSLLSPSRSGYTLAALSRAVEYFWEDADPLTAQLYAHDLAENLRFMASELAASSSWYDKMLASVQAKRASLGLTTPKS